MKTIQIPNLTHKEYLSFREFKEKNNFKSWKDLLQTLIQTQQENQTPNITPPKPTSTKHLRILPNPLAISEEQN